MTTPPTAAPPAPVNPAASAAARCAGNAAFKARDYAAAVAFYQAAAAVAPPCDSRPLANAAAAALRLGDAAAARAWAAAAVAADPAAPRAHARLAEAAAAENDLEACASAWEAAAALAPGEWGGKAADARRAADDAAGVATAAAAVAARGVMEMRLKSFRAATRACMRLQYQNSMAAPEWELEDYDWRPTHFPADRLTPTHSPPPAAPFLASLVAAAADVAAPRAAAAAVADAVRAAAWHAALTDAVRACPSPPTVLAVGGAGGAWGLLAAAAGAADVAVYERTPLPRALAVAGLAANRGAPWAGAVRVASGWVDGTGGPKGGGDGAAPADEHTPPSAPAPAPTPSPASIVLLDAIDATPFGAGLLRAADAVAASPAAPVARGAAVLPRRVRVLARLVDATPRPAAGVDVSALGGLRWGLQPERVEGGGPDAPAFLSAPFLVDDVDLAARVLSSPAAAADRIAAATAGVLELDATLSVPVTAAGTVNGVVTWVEVDLGEAGGWVAGCAWGDDRGGGRVAPSYGAAMHAMDGVWATKSSTLALRVRRDASHLHFTPAASPCRSPRHTRLPAWHWPMLADKARARALARGAARAVDAWRARGVDDVHVLDAGAGSGLLGVLVASSTGARVTCVEQTPALAAAAAAIVARAGVAHRVAVVCGDVRRTSVAGEAPPPPGAPPGGPTIAARAHVLLFEVFDAGGIGEGALHVAAAARRNLCVRGAVAVPAALTLVAAPVALPPPALPGGVATTHLTSWRACPDYEAVDEASPGAVGAAGWLRVGPAARALTFRFDDGRPPAPASNTVSLPIHTSGDLHGIAFWCELDVGGGETLRTGPSPDKGGQSSSATTHAPSFRTALQWLPPRPVAAGNVVTVTAAHDTYGVSFAVEGDADAPPLLPPALAAARSAAAAAAAALSSRAAASPLAMRAVASAAAAVGARPGDWGLDAGVAGGVCGRLFM